MICRPLILMLMVVGLGGSVPRAESESPPVPAPTQATLAALIADLCSEKWATREQASEALRQLGAHAIDALRKAASDPCPETRQRAGGLLSKIERDITLNNMGHTVVADTYGGRVMAFDKKGQTVWTIEGLDQPVCVQPLSDQRLLIAERQGGRVTVYDKNRKVIWRIKDLGQVWHAQRLANGHTLITTCGPRLLDRGKVIEVNADKKIVWEMDELDAPRTCQRLANGHTLIVERTGKRVIELNAKGQLFWQMRGLNSPLAAERLANGNTLITEWRPARVIEVDSKGKTVWSFANGLHEVIEAHRLPNGHTLITDFGSNRVLQVNQRGDLMWHREGLNSPCGAVRLPAIATPKRS
jgi:hypothetical protein